jgi:hypothetical protein
VRLRRNITIAFFVVSSAVSMLLAVLLYRFINPNSATRFAIA